MWPGRHRRRPRLPTYPVPATTRIRAAGPACPLHAQEEAYRICKRLHACGTSPNNPASGDARWRREGAKVNWNAFGAAINGSGDPLPGPRSLFGPHHIIPPTDPRFGVAQLIAWRCGIRPHDGVNGVWLRGPRAKKGTPGYKSLSPSARKRVYHGDTFGLRYVYVINKALLPAYNPVTHYCNRLVALHILSVLRGRLISGSPSFGSH